MVLICPSTNTLLLGSLVLFLHPKSHCYLLSGNASRSQQGLAGSTSQCETMASDDATVLLLNACSAKAALHPLDHPVSCNLGLKCQGGMTWPAFSSIDWCCSQLWSQHGPSLFAGCKGLLSVLGDVSYRPSESVRYLNESRKTETRSNWPHAKSQFLGRLHCQTPILWLDFCADSHSTTIPVTTLGTNTRSPSQCNKTPLLTRHHHHPFITLKSWCA